MNHSSSVAMRYGLKDLIHKTGSQWLLQRLAPTLLEQTSATSARDILKNYNQLEMVRIIGMLMNLHYVGVVQAAQSTDLLFHLFYLLP